MGKLENEVLKGGENIVCESSASKDSKDGLHAGMIFKKTVKGKKVLVGQTDPIFKTAEEAKGCVEKTVKGIRSSGTKPIFKKVGKKEGDKADGK